jgi:hypothetical protein
LWPLRTSGLEIGNQILTFLRLLNPCEYHFCSLEEKRAVRKIGLYSRDSRNS